MSYELVERGNKIYIRKKPFGRKFEEATPLRKENMIQFSEIAYSHFGEKYEDIINAIKTEMKPVGRKEEIREIELTANDIRELKHQMLMKGLRRLEFPNVLFKIETEKKVEKLIEAIT